MKQRATSTTFVLSGGARLEAIQVGLLEALYLVLESDVLRGEDVRLSEGPLLEAVPSNRPPGGGGVR